MKRTMIIKLLVALIMTQYISATITAQPTKESLKKAWLTFQKTDSKNLIFERLADNRYRFKTEWFPYEGELIVNNLVIMEIPISRTPDYLMGMVEVELKDFSSEGIEKFPYGYAMWDRLNRLYFSKKKGEWLTETEYQKEKGAGRKIKFQRSEEPVTWFDSLYSLILLILIIIVTTFVLKQTKKGNANIKKSMALSEEQNRLLKEILEELKRK